ncbi:MAG: 2-C-methyl-D-erythritol 4-phosphate cytidylyltransferase, partial [Rhodospirillaceae bacterium]
MKVAALIVSAGRGTRFGGDVPKQYRMLDGRPVLRHSLAILSAHPAVAAVRAVINPSDRAMYDAAAAGLNLLDPVDGGAERQESVRLGLESLEGMGFDAVLVHDAARPYLSRALVTRVLDGLAEADGAVPALPVADTLKRSGADALIAGTVPRDGLWRAQTPQGFRFEPLLKAHRAAAGQALTDDAAVIEAAGGRVR